MTIEFRGLLRRRKPEKRRHQLKPGRARARLRFADGFRAGLPILLDTNVYIAEAAGRLSDEVRDLLDRALPFHCSVCLAELATGVANADPTHPRWGDTCAYYSEMMSSLPANRVLVPDGAAWLDAGVLAGTLARIQGLGRDQRKEALNDALILLTATRHGLPVLTSDRSDFDLLQQLAPETAYHWY